MKAAGALSVMSVARFDLLSSCRMQGPTIFWKLWGLFRRSWKSKASHRRDFHLQREVFIYRLGRERFSSIFVPIVCIGFWSPNIIVLCIERWFRAALVLRYFTSFTSLFPSTPLRPRASFLLLPPIANIPQTIPVASLSDSCHQSRVWGLRLLRSRGSCERSFPFGRGRQADCRLAFVRLNCSWHGRHSLFNFRVFCCLWAWIHTLILHSLTWSRPSLSRIPLLT